MDHLVQFTISIDDAHIAKMVEEKAAKALTDEVLKIVKAEIGTPRDYYSNGMSDKALREFRELLDVNKDYIVQEAAKEIANRVMKSKKSREAVIEKVGAVNETTD